jgi:16S rRNA (guanine527-N7)-methyltransferase
VPDAERGGSDPSVLTEVLLAAREAGFLGPGPIERQLRHAHGFTTLARRAQAGADIAHLLDLGSGGGLPGLVIAMEWQTVTVVLLEANQRRSQFLERAVRQCGLQERVRVLHQRAEVCGRNPSYRGAFDGVVVRSFGPPAVVAECSAPLLRVDGWLIVSEPPSGEEDDSTFESPGEVRWPPHQLVQLELEPVEYVRDEFGYEILRQRELCPDRFPRRNGVPSKRPLF